MEDGVELQRCGGGGIEFVGDGFGTEEAGVTDTDEI